MLRADANGRYEIQTIVPRAYPIPTGVPGLEQYGALTHARHIHIKVLPLLNVALKTQRYFKGDEHLPTDPWGGHKTWLALALKQRSEFMVGELDFVLGTGLQA